LLARDARGPAPKRAGGPMHADPPTGMIHSLGIAARTAYRSSLARPILIGSTNTNKALSRSPRAAFIVWGAEMLPRAPLRENGAVFVCRYWSGCRRRSHSTRYPVVPKSTTRRRRPMRSGSDPCWCRACSL